MSNNYTVTEQLIDLLKHLASDLTAHQLAEQNHEEEGLSEEESVNNMLDGGTYDAYQIGIEDGQILFARRVLTLLERGK